MDPRHFTIGRRHTGNRPSPLRWLLTLAVGLFMVSCTQSFAEQTSLELPMSAEQPAASADQLTHPPLRQSVTNQRYRFEITAVDGWETPAALGTLYESGTPRWEVELAHQYGPRFALVSPTGQVLLIDEFINVASSRAIALYTAQGDLIAQHSFDDIQQALGISRASLTQKATSGWWVSAPPTLNEAGDLGLVQTGGTTLSIDLLTGHLSSGHLSSGHLSSGYLSSGHLSSGHLSIRPTIPPAL